MEIALHRVDGALRVNPSPPYVTKYLRYHHRTIVTQGYRQKTVFEERLLHSSDGSGGVTTFQGFFSPICDLIHKHSDTFTVTDDRSPLPEIDWEAIGKINWAAVGSSGLRDYQVDPVIDFLFKLQTNSGIARATGGWGKTILQAATYAAFNRLNTVLAIPLKSVFDQTYKKFVKLFPDKHIGRVGGGHRDLSPDITISTFASLGSCSLEKCRLLLVDEIQGTTGEKITETLMGIPAIRAVGYTATDEGMFNKAEKLLTGLFGERLIHIEYQEAEEAGAVVPGHVFFVRVPTTRRVTAGTITGKLAQGIKNHPERNKLIGEVCSLVPDQWQTIVFVDHVHDHLVNVHKEMPVGSKFVHRDSDKKKLGTYALTPKEQDRTVAAFENNEFQFLLASDCLRAGTDIPNCRVVVQAAGGSSEIEILQEAYRGSRTLPEALQEKLGVGPKTHMVIVDFLDAHDPALEGMSEKRMAYYEKEGWSVTLVDTPAGIVWKPIAAA